MNTEMPHLDTPEMEHLYDLAYHEDQLHRQRTAEWALAEAARAGTHPAALEVLANELGVRHENV